VQEIEIKINDVIERAEKGSLLSDILGLPLPCGGHGKCGKCKVKAVGELSPLTDTERNRLTEEEIKGGFRLACKTRATGNCSVEYSGGKGGRVVTSGIKSEFEITPAFTRYGIAVDVGTTTIAAKLFDARGNELSSGGSLNAQSAFGADVISRIEAYLSGHGEELKAAVNGVIDGLIVELTGKAGVNKSEIDGVVITGNTVMLSLLTGESVEPFSHAPFMATRLFGEDLTAGSLGLKSLNASVEVYLPRCVSAFVGADITTAMTAIDFADQPCAVMVDVGTNGEIAFVKDGKITVCSTAAGPAFEGVGISSGMNGSAGAVDKVFVANGKLLVHVIGEGEAKGICGSGIIDAVACLLDIEELDETGYMEDDVTLIKGVTVTKADIRAVQLAKSALSAGIKTLIKDSKTTPRLYVAGGFGSFINLTSAAKIGLIPPPPASSATVGGNAALQGAVMLLLNKNLRYKSEALACSAEVVDLATNKTFIEEYTLGMMFE